MENEENILYAAFQYLLTQNEEYQLGMVRPLPTIEQYDALLRIAVELRSGLLSPASYRVLQDWQYNILPRRFYPHH
jgi:hypothetical protein